MRHEKEVDINEGNIGELRNWGEKVFASACIRVGIDLKYQIPIGESVIDFQVLTRTGNKKLIEVTSSKRRNAQKDKRKRRQIRHMEESGMDYGLLCNEELVKIQNENIKH